MDSQLLRRADRSLDGVLAPEQLLRHWGHRVPPLLRPLLRAYVLGYASAVAPRVLTLVLQHATAGRRRLENPPLRVQRPFWEALLRILRGGLGWQRFPTFCALLVGGSTLLEVPLSRVIRRYFANTSSLFRIRLARWLATFVAAWLSLQVLQSKTSPGFTDTTVAISDVPAGGQYHAIAYGGRTLDLTLFAVTRALDVLVGEWWSRRRDRRTAAWKWLKTETLVSRLADPALFATSCALIMWTWIYVPSRLPRAYDKWISSAAAVDPRLLEALQRCRTHELRYGEDTGHAPLLQSMCRDFGWPLPWGDPAVSVPFPCEMVHMGSGPSCERHALRRFFGAWRWSMTTYLSLSLLLVARHPSKRGLVRAVLSAARSSAFLGSFIALFYYGVCLARTRIGPRVLSDSVASRQALDSGVCVGSGCLLCGWSILLENPGRRKDMALFVAPRALATLLPRRYPLEKQWRETFIFATSVAVVFTCVRENKERVRGLLGRVLWNVLEP